MQVIIFQILPDASSGQLSSTLAFLTAMITPALLISAIGMLVLSTSTRLGRVIDRARELERRLNMLMTEGEEKEKKFYTQRVEVVFELLDKVTTRSRILQRALFVFYCGLAMFVLTSLSIAIVALLNQYVWIPIPVGLVGTLFIFYGSILMMRESLMATATTNAEMNVTWKIAIETAPREIVEQYIERGFGKRGLPMRNTETE